MTRKSSKNFIYGVAPATLTLSLSLNPTKFKSPEETIIH